MAQDWLSAMKNQLEAAEKCPADVNTRALMHAYLANATALLIIAKELSNITQELQQVNTKLETVEAVAELQGKTLAGH